MQWPALKGPNASPFLKHPLGSPTPFPFHLSWRPSTIICPQRSYHIQMTAHLIHLWLCLSPSPWSEAVSLFQHSDKVYFEPCIWCYSHIALDNNLSHLFYCVSIILNIRNCKSQDRLGYGTLPTMIQIQRAQMQMYNSISSELAFHSITLCHVERGRWP